MLGQQARLGVAAHVDQQPADQERRHVAQRRAPATRPRRRTPAGNAGIRTGAEAWRRRGDGGAEFVQPLALVRLDRRRRARRAAAQSSGTSSRMPCPSATSIMLSATTTGRPSSSACVVEVEVAFEVGGVRRWQTSDVGPGLAGLLAEDHVHGDHLVGAARREAVRPRQVDEVERHAGAGHLADLRLDRHAGVVADAVVQPGEGVEEGRLAGVGVAQQGGPEATRRRLTREAGWGGVGKAAGGVMAGTRLRRGPRRPGGR